MNAHTSNAHTSTHTNQRTHQHPSQVKLAADLFSRVRRAGPGHGVVHIDFDVR